MKTTLLLDADIIAFKVAAASEQRYQFPGCEPSVMAQEWDEVVPRIDEEVNKLTQKLETENVVVCLSCPTFDNWRLDVLPSYKANRDYSKRPVHLEAVKKYLEKEYESHRKPRLEADDVLGILSTHPTLIKGKKVIVSEDKDLKTVPGWLFNPAKDKHPKPIDELTADYWHLYQTLVGDATDNYKGCPRVGPVKAAAVLNYALNEPDSLGMWPAVAAQFLLKGLTYEDALVQARVARICRHTDYDFANKRVIPWTPVSLQQFREDSTA